MRLPLLALMAPTSGPFPNAKVPLKGGGLRPPAAAAYLGSTPFHVEELMRDGILLFRFVGGARVISIEDLDKYFESIPKQTGRLHGRGRFLEKAAA